MQRKKFIKKYKEELAYLLGSTEEDDYARGIRLSLKQIIKHLETNDFSSTFPDCKKCKFGRPCHKARIGFKCPINKEDL